ncbi:MAG: hypothetical protein K2X81_23145, partial [Candidatus Obscuribacterales bacterium]|nr:hypothetical protein [Candidatus Obscuribacterales bacterium]
MAGSSVRIIPASTDNNPQEAQHKDQKSRDAWGRVVPFAVIFLLACTLFFAELGRFPLFNPDEALYAEPAREMIELGNWIT